MLCLFSPLSGAQSTTQNSEYWVPNTPVFSQKFDWLQLQSGEWLKGDIISMYDDELEFDSDEFNLLTFDWDDVKELRSRFDQQIRFADGKVKEGFLVVKDNHVVLISEGSEQFYPLAELLSITSSSDDRRNLWDGKISIGIDLNAGNVNQLDYIANGTIQRRTPFTRFKMDLIYNYSKSTRFEEANIITDTTRLTTYLDWFYSSKIFFRMFDYEYYADLQQNIQSRSTIGLSFGYHIIENKRLQWEFTVGPSYQATSYYDVDATLDQKSGVLALGTLFEYSFSSKIDYIVDYQIQFVEDSSGKRNSHLQTGFEFEFSNKLDVDLTFSLDRVAQPISVQGSEPPKANDYRLVFGLGYSF